MLRTSLWLVPVVLALLLATAAGAGQRGYAPARGYLTLDGQTGGALPTKDGVSLVNVDCRKRPGPGTCAGTVRILPRGAQTKELVGSAPIASGSARLRAAETKNLRLRLSARARAAIRGKGTVLTVTVEARSNGKRWARPMTLDDFAPFRGHTRPTSTRRLLQFTPDGALTDEETYQWKWDIPVRHYLILPEFTCPDDHPWIASNGKTIWKWNLSTWWDVGLQAKLDVGGSSNAGYGGFNVPTTHEEGVATTYHVMTGWPKGAWNFNSIWAPVAFDDAHFELKATCSNTPYEIVTGAAYSWAGPLAWMFPWGQ
jgi:hypothetical protein